MTSRALVLVGLVATLTSALLLGCRNGGRVTERKTVEIDVAQGIIEMVVSVTGDKVTVDLGARAKEGSTVESVSISESATDSNSPPTPLVKIVDSSEQRGNERARGLVETWHYVGNTIVGGGGGYVPPIKVTVEGYVTFIERDGRRTTEPTGPVVVTIRQ